MAHQEHDRAPRADRTAPEDFILSGSLALLAGALQFSSTSFFLIVTKEPPCGRVQSA